MSEKIQFKPAIKNSRGTFWYRQQRARCHLEEKLRKEGLEALAALEEANREKAYQDYFTNRQNKYENTDFRQLTEKEFKELLNMVDNRYGELYNNDDK